MCVCVRVSLPRPLCIYIHTRWYPARCYRNFYKIWRCNLKVETLKWLHHNILSNNTVDENTSIIERELLRKFVAWYLQILTQCMHDYH
jgi:hypothetical protein